MGSSHKIDIGGLLAGGRQRLVIDDRVALEPFEAVKFPQPAEVHLELYPAGEMLEILGAIDVALRTECDRCLELVDRKMHVDVDERIETGEKAQADPLGESNVLSGDRLDVGDLASQVVCAAVPLAVLCAQDCKGICTVCGENKNIGACSCARGNGEV